MTETASGLVLGFLLSTAYGAAFHLILGGPARRLALYVVAAWIGFALGQLIGLWLDIRVMQLGAIYLFSASVGSWTALIASRWLGVLTED